jgi:D-methionine transport system permease protein
MGGAVGAGGLGQIGYQYGYIGYDAVIMNLVLALLVAIVFIHSVFRGPISQKI